MIETFAETDWRRLQEELQKARLEAQRLSASLADAWEELTLLYDLAEQLRGVLDIDQAVELALIHATDIVSVEGCGVLLKNEGNWELHGAVCPPGREEWLRVDLGVQVAEEALRRKRGFIANDFAQHPRWGEGAKIFGIFNIVVVPLNPGGHAQGALIAWNRKKGEFTSGDLKLLSTIAAQTSGVLESAFLYQRLQETFRGVVRAMAVAVDAKSRWTAGHSIRVTRYAVELAHAIGLPESEAEKVNLSGLLHDLGKIGVPDTILDKPGKLDGDEWEVMKQHPIIGYEMLKDIWQFRGTILDGVLYHHERVDGKGYPFGLKGDEIPLVGRLLAIADGYDAMTSDRPYRAGMPKERALEVLMECAGTQWDKELVKVFIDIQRAQQGG
ncbi:MAG: HD domain-containing protein [Armatimonadetes bacterium]|nr:HD domain-containing protein [Armatimonadota bacterium]